VRTFVRPELHTYAIDSHVISLKCPPDRRIGGGDFRYLRTRSMQRAFDHWRTSIPQDIYRSRNIVRPRTGRVSRVTDGRERAMHRLDRIKERERERERETEGASGFPRSRTRTANKGRSPAKGRGMTPHPVFSVSRHFVMMIVCGNV